MIKCNKRYLLETHRWGKDWSGKAFYKTEKTECDTLDEINEFVQMTKEIYSDVIRPDIDAKYKYRAKTKSRWSVPNEDDYIYDDTHYWWGYAVFDFETQKVIMEGGEGFQTEKHPMKSLRILDLYFRGDDEVPKHYKWADGEYQGWLQFRWGDGNNSIEKVRLRKQQQAKAAERRRLKEIEERKLRQEASEEDMANYLVNPDSEYDDLQDEYDRLADEQAVKYNMEKYGW